MNFEINFFQKDSKRIQLYVHLYRDHVDATGIDHTQQKEIKMTRFKTRRELFRIFYFTLLSASGTFFQFLSSCLFRRYHFGHGLRRSNEWVLYSEEACRVHYSVSKLTYWMQIRSLQVL